MKRAATFLAGFAIFFVAVAGSAAATPQKDELKKLVDQIGVLESVLNRSIAQTFAGPFGILDKARGAYLPGYGVVLDFELNLSPNPPLGSFASLPTPKEIQQRHVLEVKRRQQALELARNVISDYGHTLTALAPNESVAIVIHTVSMGEQGLDHSVIVVQATKKAIDEYHANAIDRSAFLRKLDTTEY